MPLIIVIVQIYIYGLKTMLTVITIMLFKGSIMLKINSIAAKVLLLKVVVYWDVIIIL